MTAPTNKDFAYQLESYLLTLPTQYEQVRKVVQKTGSAHALEVLDAFGEQLREVEDVIREAAQRLASGGEKP